MSCTTPGGGDSVVSAPDQDSAPALDVDERRLSEALAEFGTGVLKDGLQDPGAGTNFAHAIELYPEAVLPHVRLAAFHLRQGHGDQAMKVMKEACERNPKSLELRLWAAQICLVLQKPDMAEKIFRDATRDFPTQAQIHLKFAEFLLSLNREVEAIAVIEKGLARASDRRPLLRWLGDYYGRKVEAGDPRENRKENLRKAIDYLERLEKEPEDEKTLDSLQNLGELYLVGGQLDKAISCFKRVEACEPNDAAIKKRIAESYVQYDEAEKAITSLSERLTHDPDNPDFRLALGALNERTGDIESAVEWYEGLIELEPDNAIPYLRLALLYMDFSPEDAVQTLEKGLAHMPDNLQMLEFLAHLHVKNHNPKGALNVFENMRPMVERANKPAFSLRFNLYYAAVSEKCRQYARAAELYAKTAELNPDLPELRAHQAMTLFKAGQTNAALDVLDKDRDTFKDNPSALFFFAAAYQQANRHDQAMVLFRQLETLALNQRAPDEFLTSDFYFNFGASCERAGQFDEAIRLLQKAISLNPKNAEALNYAAYMWAEKGLRLDQAFKYIQQALGIDPENGAFLDTLAWVYHQQGDDSRALAAIQMAIVFIPDDPTVLDHLGDIHFALGNAEAAADAWRQSLAVDPSNAAVRAKYTDLGFDPAEVPPRPPPKLPPEEKDDEETD